MPRSGPAPLTPYQRDIWASAAHLPESPQFNCSVSVRFTGPLDVDLLRECLGRALDRNDAFRLRFAESDGVPYQWVTPEAPPIRLVDLSATPDPWSSCLAWQDRADDRPIRPDGGAMCEVTLLRESDTVTHLHVKAHHIVVDGWALHLFVARVREDYATVSRTGRPSASAPPAYLDVAGRSATYLGSPDWERDRAALRATLDEPAEGLFHRTVTPARRRSVRYRFPIERALVDRLREQGDSPYAFVVAMLAVQLSRVRQHDRVVLGIPLGNRHDEDERQVAGLFANLLPLVVRPDPTESPRELAGRIRLALRQLRQHERLPLGDLLRGGVPTGEAPRRPFDVTVTHLRWPPHAEIPGVRTETGVHGRAHHQDALALYVNELDPTGDLTVELDYAADVFDADFPIAAFARQLRVLLRHGVELADKPLTGVSMFTPAERRDLLGRWNRTRHDHPLERTLPELLEEQAARTPDRPAVVAPDPRRSLTYAELDALTERAARALRADGVGPGDRVAVLVERGPRMLVAILATLRAGAAYLPLDCGFPEQRIRHLVADGGVRALIVDEGSPVVEPPPAGVVVRSVDALLAAAGSDRPAPVAGARDLAYVIYTSGSTGNPKGVMVEHRSVINRLAWMQRQYPLDAGDVLLQKTPISFDVSVWELFWWTLAGARLALLPPGAEKDPREMVDTMTRQQVTVVHFVPSMLGPFLDLLEAEPALRPGLARLRYVFCSGEALPPAHVRRFNRIFASAGRRPALVNLYGPTEATVDVSWFDCPTDPADPVRRVPIGRPIDNLRMYVLGADGEPQPCGAAGELYVAGVGVARGYLGRPDLTRERFTDDPFVPGERMYRTGDLARRLADGTIEYLGRRDGQVKIRGNRVELGEVQSRLATYPGVRDAVVVDRDAAGLGAHLVGYYVAADDLDPGALRAHCADALPGYMVPSRFARIPRIPLTANGKLDRAALTGPADDAGPVRAAPSNPTEAAIAEIWASVLGLPEVGVHDNYFTIGGDSILSLRIRAQAERRGIHFSLADLVRHSTVAELALRVRTGAERTETPRLAPFELVAGVDRSRLAGTAGVVDAYPATRMQLGLLYHSRERERTAVFHDVFRYTLRMPWREEAFRAAVERLVARHPTLRTGFDLGGYAEPLQLVHDRVEGGLEVVDLRPPGAADCGSAWAERAEREIEAHVRQRRYRRYDVERPPLYLFRMHVLPDRLELVLSFHHAILDGWSVASLIAELCQDYRHGLDPASPPAPAGTPPSPAYHAAAERAALESAASRRYWRDKLDPVTPAQFDGFRAHQAPGDGSAVVRRLDLPADLDRAVDRFARRHALPVKSILLAAHCLTLRLFAGGATVTTGLVTHGRPERDGAERTAGLFLNTLPILLDATDGTWRDVVAALYRQERDDHPHRRYPLSAIVEETGAALSTAFNYVRLRGLAGLAADGTLVDFRTWEETNFALLVNVIVGPDGDRLGLRVDCDGALVGPDQADLAVDTLLRILERIVTRPDEPVDLGFLPPAGPAGTATDAGSADLATAPAGPGGPTTADAGQPPADVVRLFAAQVARDPGATAVTHGDRRWSYGQLDRAAEQVARRLVTLGAAGSRIGIALDRSPELIATVLGVLRAGAACVPLDVSYPARRLALMVAQARPLRVVTQRRHVGLIDDASLALPVESILDPPDLDTRGGVDAPEDADRPPLPDIAPESTAYLLFTSGSTGRPKGVPMPHRALANLVRWQLGQPSGTGAPATLQFAPLSFDVSFQEIFATLCAGGRLHLVGEEDRQAPAELLRILDREEVERVFLPYVALQELARTGQALGLRPRRLRVLVSAGEQLRVTEEIRAFCAGLDGVLLENQYGPTETHVVTSHPMTGDPAGFPVLPPIGRPVDGSEALVLDARMRPVPVGVPGELYLGGICLADGYHDDPELTRRRFVDRPGGGPTARLFRTGDLARVLPDGSIVWLGRDDDQVKVRGFRVEPAEVEMAVLSLSPDDAALRQVAVVARRRGDADAFLAAFLVGDADRVDLGDLRSRLRALLPEHLVPARFEWLPELPRTASGKRDDAALRALPLAAVSRVDAAPPRDPYERHLVEILAELLHLPTVGVRDDFFDLGGTSLTAMRLIVLIEHRYDVRLPLATFVAGPTVEQLAAWLRTAGTAATPAYDPVVPIRVGGARRPIFVVHPLGGNVLCYARLGRELPDDQPLYALQAAGIEPGTEPLTSVPELARAYLAAIRRVQPDGPYTLAGWSFGGFVAFEMARQLRQGDPDAVAHLILLDPIARDFRQRPPADDHALLEWFFWELIWQERGGRAPVVGIPAELDDEAKFDFIAGRAVAAGLLPSGASTAPVRRLYRVFRANWQAILDYRPPVTDQDIVLLRASGALPDVLAPMHRAAGSRHLDATNGWADLTRGRVDVIDVPGDHLVLLEEPHVSAVAREVVAVTTGRRTTLLGGSGS
ncbi:amino acid adenylation domain-containing protein [Micromonospora sp. WMMD882]|uniref:amino acid adenylation domain-containing protein n=1 Tax=Micromonospora sp. WMMD882 TaxID=3015151 RepID=UPI00248B9249|nr:non-ribosomal peptide synthetase [Micromonospora sp. WMMD882]WBB80295.1 amino acid adenylation domain-containing protein [Micromonospora sp. WMMD882]